jgi:His-Xaa-Ser system radical SAM maturase HxsC
MLKLSSSLVLPLGNVTEDKTSIRRLSDNPDYVPVLRGNEYYLVGKDSKIIPEGFAGYFFFEKPTEKIPENSFLLEPDLAYLKGGDIVKINTERKSLRTLYRKNSFHNSLLMTERCNNFCLMCSQPPKEIDDSYIINDVMRAIPLMSPETQVLGITGGEPTLLGDKLVQIIRSIKNNLPQTSLHILSNGRTFKNLAYCKAIAEINHSDLMIGIPIYSDISSMHDYVVQADGAFDDTIRGIINLKSTGVKVEIRVVVHKATYQRLPQLAQFIRRNLTFCDRVAIMGLEMTGFTKINLEKLWIDPKDYQSQLKEAVALLDHAKMTVSIYNHQLCILDPSLHRFNVKSISDWKNEYMPECVDCLRKEECGGFFSSAKLRYSSHIKPFVE